jgi:hypothetical protein
MIFQNLDRWEQAQLKQIHSRTYVRGYSQSVKGKQGNGQRSYARDNQMWIVLLRTLVLALNC